ncbi:cation:proton antiporter [Streptomyces sp. NPDC053755]|uniref:cation:proton antiporter n=1 Tax=Streptomyces sp. NPDC053755 TaxID=3155815 RepID=UPI00342FB0E4
MTAASTSVPLDAIVMADVAVVLLVGALMVALGRRLHQPPVVAEIAAGLMLGPSVLGLLPGDLPALIFPPEARPALSALAQVGLALFMFLAGWELDLGRLRGRTRSVGSTAVLAMAVPFAVGAGAAALLYRSTAPDGVGADIFVLYLATAFSITAFPVLARIIRDRGLGHTPVGTLAMACAAAGDVVAWCVLVLVVALAGAGGTGGFFTVLALTALYAAVMVFAVRPLLHRLLRPAAPGRPETGARLVLVVAGVLLSSYATSWIGIHAIFGAFAFGLVMPRPEEPRLRRRLAAPLEKTSSLLLPVFFVLTGLSVDIGDLGATGFLALLLVLTAAVVGKYAGAVIPARLSGMSWRDAGAFGTLMNTRGLTELVILGVGRELGLIGPQLFTMMVLMALVTTAMAGPLLRLLGVGDAAAPAGGGDGGDQAHDSRKQVIGVP